MHSNIINSFELGKKICRMVLDVVLGTTRYMKTENQHSQNLIRGFNSAYKRNASKGAGV